MRLPSRSGAEEPGLEGVEEQGEEKQTKALGEPEWVITGAWDLLLSLSRLAGPSHFPPPDFSPLTHQPFSHSAQTRKPTHRSLEPWEALLPWPRK